MIGYGARGKLKTSIYGRLARRLSVIPGLKSVHDVKISLRKKKKKGSCSLTTILEKEHADRDVLPFAAGRECLGWHQRTRASLLPRRRLPLKMVIYCKSIGLLAIGMTRS